MNIPQYIKEAIYNIQDTIKMDIQGTHKNFWKIIIAQIFQRVEQIIKERRRFFFKRRSVQEV